jgi:hypothetical protein
MAQAKQRWRRFTNKPVRKARRFAHAGLSLKGYGKGTTGKGKSGKGRARYNVVCEFLTNLPANCPNNSEVLSYFQKGKGKGSSGKGFGRTGNPKDRDGNVMTCSICGSTEHFRANCTQSSSDPPTVGLSQPTAQPSGNPAGRYLNRTLGTEPQGNFQIASRPDPPKRQEDSPFGDLLAGRDEGPTRAANETTYLSNRTDTNLYTSTFMVHEGPLIQEVTTEEERAKIVRETRETLLADMANGYVPPEFGPSLPTANGRATSLGADILPDAWEAAAKANLGKPLYMDTTKVPASWGTLTRSPEAATSSLDAKDKEPVIRSTGIASAFAASTGSPAEPKFPQAQPSCIIEKTLGTLTRAPDGTWNTYSADASKPLFAPTGNAITDNFLAISAHRGKQAVTNFQQQKKEKTARNEVSAFQLAALNRSPVADALVPDDHFWPFGSTKANPSNPQQAQIQAAAPGPYVAYHPAEPPKPLMNIPVSSPDTTYNPLHSWHENRLQQLQAIPLLKRAEAQWKQQLTAEATERAKLLVAAQLAANPAAGPSVVPMAKALVEEPAQPKPLFADQSELAAAAHRAAAAVLAPPKEQFNIATPPRDSGVDTEGIELDLQPPSTSVGCNLCGKSFAVDDDFVRLYCGHPFHTSCWRYRKSQIPRGCRCNVCHGPPDEAARLRWVGIFTNAPLCGALPTQEPASESASSTQHGPTTRGWLNRFVNTRCTATEVVDNHVKASLEAPPSFSQAPVRERIDLFGGGVHTPRTPPTTPRSIQDLLVARTPGSPRAALGTPRTANDSGSEMYIVLPATYGDYQSWEKQFDVAGHTAAPNVHTHDEPLSAGVFHTNTQLKDGRPSLLVDPGSKGNLGGEATIRGHARAAQAAGQQYSATKRNVPLNVMGVGNGSQSCPYDCTTALGLQRTDGSCVAATYTAPIVPGSDLPALLGLDALMAQRALLDLTSLQLHFIGPGNLQLDLPAGTDSFQLEVAPSGHLVLPCGNYSPIKTVLDKTPLTLLTAEKAAPSPPHSSM